MGKTWESGLYFCPATSPGEGSPQSGASISGEGSCQLVPILTIEAFFDSQICAWKMIECIRSMVNRGGEGVTRICKRRSALVLCLYYSYQIISRCITVGSWSRCITSPEFYEIITWLHYFCCSLTSLKIFTTVIGTNFRFFPKIRDGRLNQRSHVSKTSQKLRMLSRSLSDCKSLLFNIVMIQVSQFVSFSQLCH